MAEELTFEQLARDCGAVDFNQRTVMPQAPFMDSAGHQFLSDSSLAKDKYGGIGGSDHLDLLEHPMHSGTSSEDCAAAGSRSDLLLQILVLRLQALAQPVVELNPLADIAPVEDHIW